MTEGIYAMYFTGHIESGHGLLMLKTGIIAGADAAGGIYDGSYTQDSKGTLNIHVPRNHSSWCCIGHRRGIGTKSNDDLKFPPSYRKTSRTGKRSR